MLQVVFKAVAQADLHEAYTWYENKKPGLGRHFLEAVEAALERVRANPKQCQLIHADVRSVRVSRFPYSVLYRERSQMLVVLAVFHGRRDPEWIHKRLSAESP